MRRGTECKRHLVHYGPILGGSKETKETKETKVLRIECFVKCGIFALYKRLYVLVRGDGKYI